MIRLAHYTLFCALTVFWSGAVCLSSRADQALVVGVQTYPDLPPEANGLRGCVPDAEAVAAELKAKKFTVTLLTDNTPQKPTRENITLALTELSKTIRPDERFVFYFAGHGSNAPKPMLLTRDCRVNGKELSGGLDSDALYAAVASVPARSRSILLDACYSGGMSKGERGRYYAPSGARLWTFSQNSSGADVAQPSQKAGQTEVCYFTASLKNELATETSVGKESHGVFTQQLIKGLKKLPPTWADFAAAVKNGVYSDLGADRQNPNVSTPFLDAAVFEAAKSVGGGTSPTSPASTASVPTPGTLWDLYLSTVADPARMKISLQPDLSLLTVNSNYPLTAGIGMEGYLVIIDRSQDKHLYLLYPDPTRCSVDEARVSPSLAMTIGKLRGDAEGSDRVKAFLFTNREYAEQVIGAFRGKADAGIALEADVKVSASDSLKGAKKVRLTLQPSGPSATTPGAAPFYTSELSLQFVSPSKK